MDLAQGGPHTRAFDLEAADRPAVFHPLGGLRVISRGRIQHYQRGRIFFRLTRLNKLRHIAQHGQAADAEQVDLDQPERLDRIEIELRDRDALAARAHHRHQVSQGAGRHHHTTWVDGQMARQFEQRFGFVEDVPVGGGGIRLAQFSKGRGRFRTFFAFFHAGPKPIWKLVRHLPHPGCCQTMRLGHIAQGRARPEPVDRPDHRHALSKTCWITPSRRREHRSVSMSGGVLRAGLRKRSKNRSRRSGSGLVMPRQWATSEEAADPRDENGTPVWRAKSRISSTIRKMGS